MSVIKRLMHITVSIYMVLVIAVMPFYNTEGYGSIGTNKYQFFYGVTTKIGIIFLALWCIYMLTGLTEVLREKVRNGNKWLKKEWKENIHRVVKENFSATDIFALIYGVLVILSYLHSDYRQMTAYGSAWNGANGWYMGFTTQLLFLAVYFAVSRFWRANKVLPALWIPVALAVFFLGYLNRFSVYPIKMKYANPSFISTIGNINWYCAYVVTVLFGILYYWWSGEEKKKWLKGLLVLVSIIGFGTLATQGSNSGHLALAAVCAAFYLLAVKDGKKMQGFWMVLTMFGAACTVTAVLRRIFPGKFVYKDTVTDLLTYSVVPVVVLVISLILWAMLGIWSRKGRYPEKVFAVIGKVGMITGGVLLGILIILIAVNTAVPGSIGKLSEIKLFTFNMKWGSSRAATYYAGIRIWLDQDFIGKLIGVGPDSMAMYIHAGGNQELLALVEQVFGGKILTNAHCEWLTILVNMGMLGAIGFGGMIISAIVRYIKAGESNEIAAACGMSIFAYTVNNMVSFQQAMATAAMFLILGMGEAFIRKQAMAEEKISQQCAAEEKMRQQGVPEKKMRQQDVPEKKMRQQGVPEEKMRQQGVPEKKIRQQGAAEEKMRQQDVPKVKTGQCI